MFGASEDRARQLAYRKRRERIVSGSCSSTCRSLNSASRISRIFRVSSVPGQDTTSSSGVTNNHHTDALRTQPTSDPISATEAQHHRMERHRIQAEYLSQVLYNSLSLPADLTPVPDSGSYSDSGKLTKTRHIRTVTAPVASLKVHTLVSSASQPHSNLAVTSFLFPRTCSKQLRAQTMAMLRGGGQDDEPPQDHAAEPKPLSARHTNSLAYDSRQPTQATASTIARSTTPQDITEYHHPQREYAQAHYWGADEYNSPAWKVPISTGDYLRNFLVTLPSDIHEIFLALFGQRARATRRTASSANACRDFYRKLDIQRQALFDNLIRARGEELRAVRMGFRDLQYFPLRPQTDGVMIYHLLEATETPYGPGSSNSRSSSEYELYTKQSSNRTIPMQPYRPSTMLGYRSSSAPNFGQQSWYAGYLAPKLTVFFSFHIDTMCFC
jgi:hypothetical protein